MVIIMETEVKTLVYRDRNAEKQECGTDKKKRSFAAAAIALAVFTVVFAVAGIIGRGRTAEAEQTAAADESAAEDISKNAKNLPALPANSTAFKSCAVSADEEATGEVIIYLMSGDDEHDNSEDGFIPAVLGTELITLVNRDSKSQEGTANAGENGQGTEAGTKTRVDEIEELVENMQETPKTLTFTYNSAMCLDLTEEEIECLERLVQAEAEGEDIYGMILVANVVLNRVNSSYFADDVKGVVFEKIGKAVQFAPVKEGGRYYTVKVSDQAREAVRRALAGEDYSEHALYFFQRNRTTAAKASWFDNSLKKLFKYGCHEFYTEFVLR